MKILWSSAALFVALLTIGGCVGLEDTSHTPSLKVYARRNRPTVYVWSDGTIARGPEEYRREVERCSAMGVELSEVELIAEEAEGQTDISDMSPESMDGQPLWLPVPGTIYSVVLTAHTHRVEGCIQRTMPHVGFLISKKGQRRPVADLHAGLWIEEGSLCAMFYISEPKFFRGCRMMCGPTYRDVVNEMTMVLMAAGIAAGTATVMAELLVPFAVAGVAI